MACHMTNVVLPLHTAYSNSLFDRLCIVVAQSCTCSPFVIIFQTLVSTRPNRFEVPCWSTVHREVRQCLLPIPMVDSDYRHFWISLNHVSCAIVKKVSNHSTRLSRGLSVRSHCRSHGPCLTKKQKPPQKKKRLSCAMVSVHASHGSFYRDGNKKKERKKK